MPSLPFDEWMRRVNGVLIRLCSLRHAELARTDFKSMHATDYTPLDAALAALRESYIHEHLDAADDPPDPR